MKKNIWEIIANQYGIPLEREFIIDELAQSPVYKFTENGIVRVGCSLPTSPDISLHILSGEVSITPKPWKPKVGETYYMPWLYDCDLDCIDIIWNGTSLDEKRYVSGFVCRTMKEALELAGKMLAVAKYRVKNE